MRKHYSLAATGATGQQSSVAFKLNIQFSHRPLRMRRMPLPINDRRMAPRQMAQLSMARLPTVLTKTAVPRFKTRDPLRTAMLQPKLLREQAPEAGPTRSIYKTAKAPRQTDNNRRRRTAVARLRSLCKC